MVHWTALQRGNKLPDFENLYVEIYVLPNPQLKLICEVLYIIEDSHSWVGVVLGRRGWWARGQQWGKGGTTVTEQQ